MTADLRRSASPQGDATAHAGEAPRGSAEPSLLEVHRLHAGYGPMEVLRGVDLVASLGYLLDMVTGNRNWRK